MSINHQIGLDNSQLQADALRASQLIKGIGDKTQIEAARIDNQFKSIGRGLVALGGTAALTGYINQLIRVRGEFQQLEIAFTTMLKSKEKSDALMRDVTQFAATTPFDLKQVAAGTKQLLAYGFQAEDMTKNLSMLGNVASGVGSQIGDLIYLYGTLKASGRVTQMDMNQFAGRGIPIYAELAKVLGINVDQVRSFVSAGRVGFPEIEKAFQGMVKEGGMFYNLMQEQSKSLTGQISNLEDSLDSMFNEIGRSNEGILSDGIQLVATLVENYKQVGDVIAGLIVTYGSYKAAVITMSAVQTAAISLEKGWTIAQIAHFRALVLLEGAQKVLNKTMLANPYVLLATAVAGLIVSMTLLANRTSAAENAQKQYNQEKAKAAELEEKHKAEIDKLIDAATNQALADLERVSALQTLKEKYPEIFSQYDVEKLKLADILAIKKQIAEEDSKKKVQENKDTVAELDAEIERRKANYDIAVKNGMKGYALKASQQGIEELIQKRNLYQQNVEADNVNAFIAGLTGISNPQLDREIKLREQLIVKIGDSKNVGLVPGLGSFTKTELETQTAALKAEQDKRKQITTTGAKDLSVANVELKRLQGERNKILTSGITPEERAKKLKEIDDQIDEVEKKIKLLSGPDTKKEAEERKKLLAEISKDELEQIRKDQDLIYQARQSKIDAMKPSTERELEQLKLDHERKITEINRQEEDLLRLTQENAEKVLKANGGKGKFDKASVKLSVTQVNAFETMRDNAGASYLNSVEKVYKELKDKYLDYTEKRKAIEEKFQKDIETLEKLKEQPGADVDKIDASINEAKRLRTVELNELDIEIANRSEAFKVWVNEITSMGLKELVSTLQSAKDTLDNSADLSDDDKAVLRAKIEALQNQIKVLQAKDPSGKKNWTETLRTMNEVNESIENIIGGFEGLDEATKSILSAATNISGAIITSISGVIALSVTGAEAIKGVERASVILAIIGAAISVVTIMINLFNSAAKKRREEEEAAIERQRQEYLGLIDYNNELRKKYEWTKKIGEAELDYIRRKGEELAKQKKANEDEQADLYAKLQNEKYLSGYETKAKFGTIYFGKPQAGDPGTYQKEVWSTLAGKTFEEISELAAQGKLSKEAQKYYEYLKKAKEEGADIEQIQLDYLQSLKELATGTTAQSITDSIIDGFKAGKRSAVDFADTFEKLMQGAVQSALAQMTDKRVLEWYDKFYEFSKDGLDANEKSQLQADWNKLISDTAKDALNLESITGTSISDNATRSASAKGIATASQESVDENNGRLTAIQGHTFSIVEGMKILQANSSQALKHLAGIETNTARLEKIENTIVSVKSGIDDINTKGIFIKG